MPRLKRGELTALNPLQWSRKFPLKRTLAPLFVDETAFVNAEAVNVLCVTMTVPAEALLRAKPLTPVLLPVKVLELIISDPVDKLLIAAEVCPVNVLEDIVINPVLTLLKAGPELEGPPIKELKLMLTAPEDELKTAATTDPPPAPVKMQFVSSLCPVAKLFKPAAAEPEKFPEVI